MVERAFSKIAAGLQEAIIRKKLETFYSPREIEKWLASPHPMLGGRTAIEMILAGDGREVERVIDALDSGAFV